ncbi:MAG TPA: sodium/proline symporter [Acidobacteriota bacterium]|nr:sodium/proline symporter [Acidobacteriota bacterium]
MQFNPTLAISFLVYTAGIITIGLYSSRLRRKTTDDFVLANRELGPWASALSASASAESGWVMLGLVGTAFTVGLSALWIMVGIGAGYLFNWFVIAERLRRSTRESGAVTLVQFIAHRFGKGSPALRYIPVIIITAAMLGYVAAQMNAAGKAFEAVFSLPYWIGVLVGAGIILAYTVTGGFRAVCWTDIVQATFMVVALIGMPVILAVKVGGYAEVVSRLSPSAPELFSFTGGRAGLALLGFVVGMLGIGLGYPGQPHVLARFKAARDTAAIRRGRFISLSWFLLVYLGAILFGLFARAYFGTLGDPEQALPLACGEFLPPVIGGFVVAAIVSAICSTADSQLIVVSTILSRDVFGYARGAGGTEGTRYQALDRWTLVILALISVLFAVSENRVIFTFVLYAWGVLGAAFGPVVILGLTWRKATKAGAIAGMVTGTAVAVVWKEISALSGVLYELVPAFVLAFLAVVVVSLLTQQARAESAGPN